MKPLQQSPSEAPRPLWQEERMVDIGDIVLFNLGKIYRPLLVTAVLGPSTISGELFFYHPGDYSSDWVQKGFIGMAPSSMHRTQWIEKAEMGSELGQWQPKSHGQRHNDKPAPIPVVVNNPTASFHSGSVEAGDAVMDSQKPRRR